MKKILFLSYLISMLSGNLSAQEILSPNELSQKLTYFYQNPDSATLKKIILTLSASSEAREKIPAPVAVGFCTSILLSRDANSVVLDRELKKGSATNQLFTYVLSFKKTRDTLVNWPTHSPEVNDMMWAAYFGTGNSKYLERLISELQYVNREDSLALFLTGGSAKWSLASNARQHQSIDKFLRSKITSTPENLRTELEEALSTEPNKIQENFVARIKEMKAKGLIPDQNSTKNKLQLSFVKNEDSGDFSFNWDNHRVGFVIEAKNIKEINGKGFFDVNGQIVQFVSLEIPANIDLKNLTSEKIKSILQGYVQYEMQYFRNELKMEISDFTSDFTTINEKYFIRWKFKVKSTTSENNVNQQIYYTTVCWDRVVSINSPVTGKENVKHVEKRLEEIAKTLTLK